MMSCQKEIEKKFVVLFLIFVMHACIVSFAGGADLSFRPSFTIRQEYDDNIFLTRDNREEDYITRVFPSFDLSYRAPRLDLDLGYTLSWWYYARLGEGHDSHNARLASKITAIDNLLFINVTDVYESVVTNHRLPSSLNNPIANRTDSNTLEVTPNIRYPIGPRTSIPAGVSYFNIWYRESQTNGQPLNNRQQWKGFAGVEHEFSAVLTGAIGAEYLADRPERIDPDNDRTLVFLKAKYLITPRLTFDGTVGYRWVDFSGGLKVQRHHYDVSLKYGFPEAAQVELRAYTSFDASVINGAYESRAEELNVKFGKVIILTAGLYSRDDKYFTQGFTNKSVGVKAGIEHSPTARLKMILNGLYQRDTFTQTSTQPNEKNSVYELTATLEYLLSKNITASIIYNYYKMNSTIDEQDIYDHNIAAQLRVIL